MNDSQRLPDDQVNIKLSICSKCDGFVRAAVEHKITTKEKNRMAKEAMQFNLSIRTIPLLEYRTSAIPFCLCDSKTQQKGTPVMTNPPPPPLHKTK